MFVIRPQQMAALELDLTERLKARLASSLKDEYPNTADFESKVRSAWTKALGYGLTSLDMIEEYVRLALAYGPDFDRHPAVARILANPEIDPNDRMEALFDDLPGRCWEELSILSPE